MILATRCYLDCGGQLNVWFSRHVAALVAVRRCSLRVPDRPHSLVYHILLAARLGLIDTCGQWVTGKGPISPPLNPPPATTSNQLPSQRQPSEGCKLISQLTIQPLQPQIPPSFFRSSLSSFALLLPLRHYSSPLITFSLSALLYFSFPFFTSLLLYCALLSSPPSACSLTATIL